jgi:hypothetical protein
METGDEIERRISELRETQFRIDRETGREAGLEIARSWGLRQNRHFLDIIQEIEPEANVRKWNSGLDRGDWPGTARQLFKMLGGPALLMDGQKEAWEFWGKQFPGRTDWQALLCNNQRSGFAVGFIEGIQEFRKKNPHI